MKRPRLPAVLRDLSLQASGGYIGQALQVVRGVIVAGVLGPLGMGSVAVVNLALSYAQHADLGVGMGVGREIPVSSGRGREDEARAWRLYGYVARLVASGIVAVGFAVSALFAGDMVSTDVRFGLATAAVLVLFQAVQSLQQTIFQASRQFGRAAASTVLLWSASLAFGVTGALVAGVRGVFISQVAAFALACVAGFALGGGASAAHLSRSGFETLLRVGFPLTVLFFMFYSLVNIDQLMIVSLLDTRELGLYTLVLYGGTVLYLLPGAVAAVVGPRLLHAYGEHGTTDAISQLTWLPAAWLSLVMPVLVMAVWAIGPWLIDFLLPEYVEAVAPLRIYVVGMFFLAVNLGVSTTLLAMRKHNRNIPIMAVCIGLNVVVDLVLVGVLALGLEGVALGSLITYASYWAAHTALVRRYFGHPVLAAVRMNMRIGWPGFLLVLVVAATWSAGVLDRSVPALDASLFAASVLLTAVRWRKGDYRK